MTTYEHLRRCRRCQALLGPQDARKTEEEAWSPFLCRECNSDAEDIPEHLMYPDGEDEQLARFREERRLSRELGEP